MFAIANAPCVFRIKNLDESALEMEGGHKRRVVEGVLAIGIAIDTDDAIRAFAYFFSFLRQEMSEAMREGAEGGSWEHKSKRKIPAMTLLLGARPKPGKDLKTEFTFSVAELKGGVLFKGGRKGDCRAFLSFNVRVTANQAEKFPTWLGTDMAVTIGQTQITLDEINARREAGEDVEKLVNPEPKKKPKKGAPEQLTIPGEIAKQENAAGVAQVTAAIDAAAADNVSDEDAEILADALGLVAAEIAKECDGVPVDVVKTWSKKDRELAMAWASAVHAEASDNAVEVPDMPDVLVSFRAEWTKGLAAKPAGGLSLVKTADLDPANVNADDEGEDGDDQDDGDDDDDEGDDEPTPAGDGPTAA